MPDLMTSSRVESAVVAAAGTFSRFDDPSQLPVSAQVDLLVVDWGFRRDDWSDLLTAWRGVHREGMPLVVLFGPHTDLEAHRAAKAAGLGPMKARSAFFAALPGLLSELWLPPAPGT